MAHCRLLRVLFLAISSALVTHVMTAHPSLILCVCSTTLATNAVVKTSTPAAKGQAAQYVVPSCVDDVFAETGIRWYIDGPVLPDVKYWRQSAVAFSTGRAAKRLLSLGYKCTRTQLYDLSDTDP